jgi:hypothetical protein
VVRSQQPVFGARQGVQSASFAQVEGQAGAAVVDVVAVVVDEVVDVDDVVPGHDVVVVAPPVPAPPVETWISGPQPSVVPRHARPNAGASERGKDMVARG